MSSRRARVLHRALLALAIAVGPWSSPAAHAQSGDVAMAQSLFDSGRELMRQGKFAEASVKLAESNRLDPSAGTLLNLGQCQEALGKTASAWATYKQAIVLARAKGQTRHETAGQEYIAAIEPKLSKLTVTAPNPPPGLVIKRDEVELGAGALGVALAVDPGTYVIRASAPGREPWEGKVEVAGDGDQETVEIPELAEAEPGEDVPPPVPVPVPEDPIDEPVVPPAGDTAGDGGDTQRMIGYVVGGTGVAAIAVGAVFGILTLGDASDAKDDDSLCPDNKCSDEGLEQIDGAEAKAWISNIGIGVGVAAVAAGVILVLTADDGAPASVGTAASAARGGVWIAPAAGPFGGGGVVGGSF